MPLRWMICPLLLLGADAWAGSPIATMPVAFERDVITAISVHGFADEATSRKVGAEGPVRITSVSKLVTAWA